MTPDGKRPLALAAFIPRDPGTPVQVWTNGNASGALIDMLRDQLSRQERLSAMAARGIAPDVAAEIDSIRVPLEVRPPARGSAREQMLIRSALPLAFAYLLLVTVMITGTRMMVGVIEERSNRLLEQVLACITPQELMLGKLIGLGAIGLTVTLVWTACGLMAANATPGFAAAFLAPAMASLSQPWMIAALIFYYLSGYVILSMVFLAVGSLSNTVQDANAYIAPVTMGIMMPVILLVNAILQNPGGTFPVVMSWIPFYTPFAMLARLGSGVSLFEIIGSAAMLIVFMAAEVYFLGRVFQRSLLNTGQPPKLAQVARLMMEKGGE
jgi:ABC-2 type transport system permease protein